MKLNTCKYYNLNSYRTEKFDIFEIHHEKVEELEKFYYVWAEKYMVYPNPDKR